MLQACGWALFRAVEERWEAGEIKFDSAKEEVPHLPPQLEAVQTSLAQKAFSLKMQACLRRQSAQQVLVKFGLQVYSGDFVYLCNLAEEMGFQRVLGELEGVWGIAARGFGDGAFPEYFQKKFTKGRVWPTSTPRFFLEFQRMVTEPPFSKVRISKAVAAVPEKEIACALWLVVFLVDLDFCFDEEKAELKVEYLDRLLRV